MEADITRSKWELVLTLYHSQGMHYLPAAHTSLLLHIKTAEAVISHPVCILLIGYAYQSVLINTLDRVPVGYTVIHALFVKGWVL